MKNIYEVLRQKETKIEQLKKELQALRIAAPLLEEELAAEVQVIPPPARSYPTVIVLSSPEDISQLVEAIYCPWTRAKVLERLQPFPARFRQLEQTSGSSQAND